LRRVSDSLGGKAVLWELFQSSQPALDLCVRLCASSPYLVAILTSNPGMIDELIDSLMLDRLPSTQQIEGLLAELCKGVDDPEPVLHSFKNSMHLHIGVRDVLGKDDIVDTHRALSDVAEACLKQVVEHEYHRLIEKLGEPIVAQGARAGESAELAILAVGKLGGREPNYHSDLDVLFLFDGDGSTRGLLPHRRHESIPNRVFFNQLGQRVVKSMTRVGPAGHLYEFAARLRPLGGGVGAAVTLEDLKNYFCHGPAQLWERQALCTARAVWASPAVLPAVSEAVRAMLTSLSWRPEYAADMQRYRLRLEQGAAESNIKRGVGGTLDIEFIVQMLQLRYAQTEAAILVPGTLDALARLRQAGLIAPKHAEALDANYRWLRRVESGLRLMNLPARHDLPTASDQLDQLAFLLQSHAGDAAPSADRAESPTGHWLSDTCARIRSLNRQIFLAIFGQAMP
jgi:glutamate-ammonia-ligase adenylyltransferase